MRRRRERLKKLFEKVAPAAAVAQDVGTPATHLSAILAGRRGLGDSLASRIETHYSLGEGWFDKEETDAEQLPPISPQAQAMAREIDSMGSPAERELALKAWRQLVAASPSAAESA